jgi:DNA-binding CsgD family transcriptional regulator
MHPVGSAGVLLGRENEIALLHEFLRELARGSGNAVLVEGEPGIGKSTLIRAVISDAAQAARELGTSGFQVFWGGGDELGQELPLLPFLDALGVRRPSANARRQTIAGLLRGEVATDRGADVPAMLAEQLIALTIDEIDARPVVLVIDDLQWADPATIKLWGRLARTAGQVPLLLVGMTRPAPQRDDLLALRRAVDASARLQLGALPQPAVAELVRGLAGGRPDAGLLRLAAGAAGNPLYLTELFAALSRSERITVTSGGTAKLSAGMVPDSLPAAIADRLGFVSAPTMKVLRAAALLGVEFAVDDLTSVLGQLVTDLVPALDEARATGVLTDSRVGLAFRHPLIRDALYAELPSAVRGAWHRDAGRALASAGAPPDRVARQLLRALGGNTVGGDDSTLTDRNPSVNGNATRDQTGRPVASAQHRGSGDDLVGAGEVDTAAGSGSHGQVGQPSVNGPAGGAHRIAVGPAIDIERPPVGNAVPWSSGSMDQWMLDWLTGTADSLVSQAPGVATELLTQAVASIPAGTIRHGWLASRLADAIYRTGDWAAAEQVIIRTLPRASDPDLIVDLYWTLTQCRMITGQADKSIGALEEALEAPGLTARHRSRLLVLAARNYLYLGNLDSASREADSALAAAEEAGDTWATGWAIHVLALGAMIRGHLTDALPLYDRGLTVTEADLALTDLGLLLQINKAVVLGGLNRYDEALATAERARELTDRVGTAIRMAQAHGALSQLLYETGRWDDVLTEMAVVPDNLKETMAACCDLGIAAVIAFHRNEPATGRGHLSDTASHAERVGQRTIAPLVLARSLDREQAGDLTEAFALLKATFDANADDLGEIEDLLGDAVRLGLKTGDKGTAEMLTEQADLLSLGSEIPQRQANALYCRGLLDRDATTLLAAAQRYLDAGRPLFRAKALEGAAQVLVENDDPVPARDVFNQAIDVYEDLGAEADVNRVLAEFRQYGIRRGSHAKHRRATSGWDALTDMELKVAAFVADGLSNPEIAERLTLSRRTVGTHVSHILKKLEVATRTDIARESALRAVTVD